MSDKIIDTTDESFEGEVLKSELPVLVDFWAPWCGPCRALGPAIEEFAESTEGKIKVVKHNTQDHETTPQNYGINAIPALLFFKGGEVVHRVVGGGHTAEKLRGMATEHAGVAL